MHQIYHSIPVMTATGIFQINLKLIPAVIRIVIHENYNCNKIYQLNCFSFFTAPWHNLDLFSDPLSVSLIKSVSFLKE